MAHAYKFLRIHEAQGLATVTIDRPHRLNTLDPETHEEMERLWPDLEGRVGVKCVVLRGEGAVFSAGGDVKDMLERVQNDPKAGSGISASRARRLVHAMLDFEKPVIAAVEGRAAGLGATLALLCDFVVVSRDAWFSDPHVEVGLVPGDGGAAIWTVLAGPHRARSVLLCGGVVTAEQAHQWGLVTEVTESGGSYERAVALAKNLMLLSEQAVVGTKISVNAWIKAQFQPILETSLAFERSSLKHPDFAESLAALAERRPTRFGSTDE